MDFENKPVTALADNEVEIEYADIAELWGKLHILNDALLSLSEASMFNKAASAEKAILTARDLMAKNIAVSHKLYSLTKENEAKLNGIEYRLQNRGF